LYPAINYLLFRVFEASRQLGRVSRPRVAAIVVEDLTWWRFGVQLRSEWINWAEPRFQPGDPGWEAFIEGQRERYPELPNVAAAVGAIDRCAPSTTSAGQRQLFLPA
jgi:hypothetical protein